MVANGEMRTESQDITIGINRIRIVQVMRNTGERDLNLLVSFALPDIDTLWIWDLPPLLPRSGEHNFVDAMTTADGETVYPQIEQRAAALGLDVTEALKGLGIALFPYASGIRDKINALSKGVKDDLVARGVLKENGQQLLPAWLLRSTIHWRQRFPAGKQVKIVHTYKPVVGRPAGSLATLEKTACLEPAEARRLEDLAASGKPPRLTVVAFQATAGASWADPIGQFKLTIEKPKPAAAAVSCRTELTAVGSTQLEHSARDHSHEDDLTVLFIE